MPWRVDEEIRRAVARCIATGQLLFISDQARRIAASTKAELRDTEDDLLSAAIAARVNIKFGRACAEVLAGADMSACEQRTAQTPQAPASHRGGPVRDHVLSPRRTDQNICTAHAV